MHVYCLRNKFNGKIYIGKSKNKVGKRENDHFNFASTGNTGCRYLYHAIRKYGKESFDVHLLSSWASSYEDLNAQEIYFISKYRSNEPEFGYNLTAGGEGLNNPSLETREKIRQSKLGKKHSPETVLKLRQAKLGKKQDPDVVQKRTKSLIGNKWNVGRIQSAEERAMRSLASPKHMLGKSPSLETRNRISKSLSERLKGETNPFFGKHHSIETKEKIRCAIKGRKHTEEELLKMSLGNTGKKRSAETRKRMSEAAKKRGVSKEHIMLMVEARRKNRGNQ